MTTENFPKAALVACLAVLATATPLVSQKVLASLSRAATKEQVRAQQEALLLAPSYADRQAILMPNPPDATNMTFQFAPNEVSPPTGGTVEIASVDNFPALIGTSISFATGFINPCGLNVPHSHPRANELLLVVDGKLEAGLILEDESRGAGNIRGTNPTGPVPQVNTTLHQYKGMLFPQGQTHFQFNPTCEPAVFVASFDSNDPGRTQIATSFFSVVPDDVLISATGGDPALLDASRIGKIRHKIPAAFAELIDSCVNKCKSK